MRALQSTDRPGPPCLGNSLPRDAERRDSAAVGVVADMGGFGVSLDESAPVREALDLEAVSLEYQLQGGERRSSHDDTIAVREAIGGGIPRAFAALAAEANHRFLYVGEDCGIHDQVARIQIADPPHELVVPQRVVQEAEAEDDVDLERFLGQHLEDVAGPKVVPASRRVCREILSGGLHEILPGLDPDDLRGP